MYVTEEDGELTKRHSNFKYDSWKNLFNVLHRFYEIGMLKMT